MEDATNILTEIEKCSHTLNQYEFFYIFSLIIELNCVNFTDIMC